MAGVRKRFPSLKVAHDAIPNAVSTVRGYEMYGYDFYDREYDRLMAQHEAIMNFAVTIGIDPDDDSEETQTRLMDAWEKHCAELYRNEPDSYLGDHTSNQPDPTRPNLAKIQLDRR